MKRRRAANAARFALCKERCGIHRRAATAKRNQIMENNQIENTDVNQQVDNTDTGMANAAGVETGGAGNGSGDAQGNIAVDVVIPDDWEQPIKDFINGISDPAGRKTFFDKFKSCHDGYQKKFTSLANDRKAFDAERASFADERSLLGAYKAFDQQMRAEGVSADILQQFGSMPNYFASLHAMNMASSHNPAEFIVKFCQRAGIDSAEKLDELLNSKDAQRARNETDVAGLKAELMRDFETKIAAERERAKLQAQVDAFAADGQHPHFTKVRNIMAQLAQGLPDASLQELYDLAVYRDPELRSAIAAEEAAARKAADAVQIAKAKRAVGVSNTIPQNATEKKTWRQVLDEQLANEEDE